MTATPTRRRTTIRECLHDGCHYPPTVVDITVGADGPTRRSLWCYRHRPDAPADGVAYPLPGHSCSGCGGE